jgi:hypothetical protein
MTLGSSSKTNDKTCELSLSDFLWQSPLLFNCHFDEGTKQAILTRCYETLWMNNEDLMRKYFFPSRAELQASLQYQSHRHDGKEQAMVTDPTSWHTNGVLPREDFSSQKGRQCGHVFRKGEPVYRCR